MSEIPKSEVDAWTARLFELKTQAMNLELYELDFINENKHCHLCSADMKGPCAYYFRKWMGCASALDRHDRSDPDALPQLTHPECQDVLNDYIKCGNRFMASMDDGNAMRRIPWYLWAQRSQMMNSPCFTECPNFNPFLGRNDFLLSEEHADCNDCLARNSHYPWHNFTQMRVADSMVWKALNEKISDAKSVASEAFRRGYTTQQL